MDTFFPLWEGPVHYKNTTLMSVLHSLCIFDVYFESICSCRIKLTERQLFDFVLDSQKIATTNT